LKLLYGGPVAAVVDAKVVVVAAVGSPRLLFVPVVDRYLLDHLLSLMA
jgi:hypothetical protein